MSAQHSIFQVIDVAHLDAERDVFMGLPIESTNKQTFHRVPIRSSCMETADDRRITVQFVQGSKCVVQSCRSLRRLLLRFHSVFVPGIKVYTEGDDGAARTNLSMGFGMYDNRSGPTAEEEIIMKNIDGLSAFIRTTLMTCDRMRTVLKMGAANMRPEQQRMLADNMDLHIVRPVMEPPAPAGAFRAAAASGGGGEDRIRSRYCYVKIVSPEEHIPEVFHTYFWTPDGRSLPLKTVLGWRNFHAIPCVEVEDVFVNKAMRSVQLKLRECIITPPIDRPTVRFSVCFPDQVCQKRPLTEDGPDNMDDTADASKRTRTAPGDDAQGGQEPATPETAAAPSATVAAALAAAAARAADDDDEDDNDVDEEETEDSRSDDK